jgi:ribosomal protein L37AE/L43A
MRGRVVSGGKELLATCPKCGKRDHFYTRIRGEKKGLSQCKACGYAPPRGTELPSVAAFQWMQQLKVQENHFLTYSDWPPAAILYWRNRRLTQKDAEKWGALYCDEGPTNRRIVVPSHDPLFPEFYVARSVLSSGKPKYLFPAKGEKSSQLFGISKVTSEEVVIMEGAFDVICSGIPNAVALLGKFMSKDQETRLVSRFDSFVVWLDRDARSDAIKVGRALARYGKEVSIVCQSQGDDPGDCVLPFVECKKRVPYSLLLEILERRT